MIKIAGSASRENTKIQRKKWLHLLYRLVFVVILVLVGYLLYSQVKDMDWHKVVATIRDYSAFTFALAVLLVATNYFAFIGYDLLARRYTAHPITNPTTMAISFVCYTFNFNLGAAVGSAGLKFKMYSERGLGAPTVARIISFCITTHWLGFALVAGAVLVIHDLMLPADIAMHQQWLKPLGVVLLTAPILYLMLCGLSNRTSFYLFGHEIDIPGFSTAVMQVVLSSLNWLMTAAILYVFFQKKIEPVHIAQVFLVGSIMAALVHVPAGMGVIESVFLTFLAGVLPKEDIIASLLVYRVFFYILPLLVAILFYVVMEVRRR